MSKVILITGASSGFGRDTAETLARAGHKVFASMRDPKSKNKVSAEALRSKGIHVLELDVTSTRSVEQAIKNLTLQAGRIDVLINNAGIASAGVTEAFTDEQVIALFDVNVIGVHRVTRAVLPTLRSQKDGLIINIGSILGRVTFPFFGVYGASKFAIEALTDSLRYELSQVGIDVALVQPSAYPTQMYASAIQPDDNARVDEYGEVGEIPAVMFNNFMTMFESDDAPNPHDIAKAILNLIDAPKGARAERTLVGTSFGADILNESTKPVQSETLRALGLSHLETVLS